jgi:ANTAR domain
VCAVAVASEGVSGAWVTAASGQTPDVIMCVTDPVAEQLAELQLTLGEGPGLDAQASAAPVLAADLEADEPRRGWPAFTPGARRIGVGAVFAFPLTIGAIRAGEMSLYRDSPGPLTAKQFGECLILADAATVFLLDDAGGDVTRGNNGVNGKALDLWPPDLARHRAQIDQATGMLTVQLGVTAGEAFVRLRAYAYARDRRLADVARDIVARRLQLDPDPAPDGEP